MHRSSPGAASGSVGWRVVVSSPSRLALGVGSESYSVRAQEWHLPNHVGRGVGYAPPGSCTHPSRSSMHRPSPRAASGSVGWRMVVSSPGQLILGVGSESYSVGAQEWHLPYHVGRGVGYAPPGSCTYPSRSSMRWSSPEAATGSVGWRMVVPSPSQFCLERRIRVVLEWCASGGCYAGCPCWAIWATSVLPALCLPPPAPLRRAAAASDWEPGSFRRVPVRVEDVGCSLVDSWAPSGALSAPRVLFGEAPLVGQCPLGELEAPVPSRAFAARRAGSGRSR